MRNEARGLMKKASLALVVVIAISIIGCFNVCWIPATKGQIVPSLPVKVWIDASPNPAYHGDTINVRLCMGPEDERLYNKSVEYSVIAVGLVETGKIATDRVKIPVLGTIEVSSDILLEIMGGSSGEWELWVNIEDVEAEGHWALPHPATIGHFYIYNYSRPSDKPYLLLKTSAGTRDELTKIVVTVEVENIGSGNAKNVEIKDQLPPSFALVSGALTQKYDNIRPNDERIYEYTITAQEEGIFILDSATATYEDRKRNSYSSTSNPHTLTIIQPPPTPALTPSPTPSPTPTPTPIEQTPTPLPSHSPTPTPLPPPPPPDDGNNSWIFLIIAVLAGIVVLFSIKPIMIAYYTMKMNKWEREGYDVSKLKEVLKR